MPAKHEKIGRPAGPALTPSLPAHAPPAVKAATRGGGQLLDKHTSAKMSAKFGHDFSSIRIHTDSRAGESAAAVGANAYALGGDIVFGAGRYNPGSTETDRLLAHELTHVAQQERFGPGGGGLSERSDASEREADRLASQVVMGRSVSVEAAPTASLHRYQAPDGDWMAKTEVDTADALGSAAEAVPILGNALSIGGALGDLGAAAFGAVTGDDHLTQGALYGAENNALNAIPLLGNLRAAGQAGHDVSTVQNDFNPNIPEANNQTAESNFDFNGGGQQFNHSIGNTFDQMFQ